MSYSVIIPLSIVLMLVTACAAFEYPNEPFTKPYQKIDNFGPERSISALPKGSSSEVYLWRIKQPNGKYINDDGTFETKVGSRGECVYAFKIDSITGRMISWRLASKGGIKRCE